MQYLASATGQYKVTEDYSDYNGEIQLVKCKPLNIKTKWTKRTKKIQ